VFSYELAGRLVAWRIGRRYDAAVYVRGAAAAGRVVPGLSDIDLIAVAPSGAHLPDPPVVSRLGGLVQADLYRADELGLLLGSTYATFGIDTHEAAYHGKSVPADPAGLLERPGLPAEQTTWRRLAGPCSDLPSATRDRQATREAAWCELVTWWRFALRASIRDGSDASDAYLCVKLVAEPLRVLLALDGRIAEGRDEALALGGSVAPDLVAEIHRARLLLRGLHRSPEAPLGEALSALVSLSRQIERCIREELPAGERVLLEGAPARGRIPLGDWRAVVIEGLPGEDLQPHEADPASPEALRRLCVGGDTGVPVIHSGDLLFEPTATPWRDGRARTLQSRFTDPVTFALLDRSPNATFPAVRGWCASDWARRAVAERSAWLGWAGRSQLAPPGWRRPPDAGGATQEVCGHLLGAARAALFSLSLSAGEPVLLLGAEHVAAATGGAAAGVLESLRNEDLPRRPDVDALRERVRELLDHARRRAGDARRSPG
jgi:hypothetical protein